MEKMVKRRCAFVRLVLLTLTLPVIRSQHVHILPSVAYVGTGGEVTLTCHHPMHPNTTVRWSRDGPTSWSDAVLEGDDRTQLASGSSLVISPFNASRHAGHYTCIVEGGAGRLVSCPSEVKHAQFEQGLLLHPENTTAYKGTNVVLRCSAHQSVPMAEIVWTRNGQALNLVADNRLHGMPTGNLYIISVHLGDVGVYQCVATNLVTLRQWRSSEALLTVLETDENVTDTQPIFAVTPESTSASEGSKVVIECAGGGYPQPNVTWEKVDSHTLPEGTYIHPTGALIVANMSHEHVGGYICRITHNQTDLEVGWWKEVELHLQALPFFEQDFSFTDPSNSDVAGLLCVSKTHSLSKDECRQNLYLLHNGTVIEQVTGDNYAGILHFFTAPSPSGGSTTRLFQCISFSPAGCTSTDVPANFADGIIPNTTRSRFPIASISNSPACTAVTTPTSTESAGASTTAPVITTPTSSMPSCNFTDLDVTPTLYLRITPLHVVVDEGAPVSAVCEVTYSGSQEVNVTWLRNGAWDVFKNPLEGVEVNITSAQQDMEVLIVARLIFKSVRVSHAGSYTCHASITCPSVQMNSSIAINVTHTTSPPIQTEMIGTTGGDVSGGTTTIAAPTENEMTTPTPSSMKPLHYPLNLYTLIDPISRNIHLFWTYPLQEENSNNVAGFKIDWNTAARITSSARTSLPTRAGQENYSYILTTDTFLASRELLVRVWAYNIQGDGPYSTVRIDPVHGPSSPTSDPILECMARATSPTSVHLLWPDSLREESESSLNLVVSCREANTFLSTSISPASSLYVIERALPSCTYTFELHSERHVAMCQVNTPAGQVDIRPNVTSLPNGTVMMHWQLPSEVRDKAGLTIEINWGQGWIPIPEGLRAPSGFDRLKQYEIMFRLRRGEWVGFINVTIPPVPPQEGEKKTNVVLVYCVIFGSIVAGCAVLLSIIVGLKYVQWSRRDKDKNNRKKSQEKFIRGSLESSSLKSSNNSDSSTTV